MSTIALLTASANVEAAQTVGGSARTVGVLLAITVAVVAFGAMSLLARAFRQAMSMSAGLLKAAATAAVIGLLAVVVSGTLLFGGSADAEAPSEQATSSGSTTDD